MNITIVDDIIDTHRVSNQIGITEATIRKNYINNQTRDKTAFIKAFSMGAFCMENNISPKELEVLVQNHLRVKGLNG